MPKPWEKYQQADGPWAKYGGQKAEPEHTTGELVADTGNQFFEGFNKSLEKMLFEPGRQIDALSDAVTGKKTKTYFERKEEAQKDYPEWYKKVDNTLRIPLDLYYGAGEKLSDFLSKDTKAKSAAGRIAETAGEVTASNILPAGVMFKAAPAIAEATKHSSKLLPGVVNTLAQTVAKAPGAAATGELAATLGSGTGVGIAKEEGAGATGQTLAGLAGAMTPAGLSVLARNTPISIGTRFIKNRLSPSVQKAKAETNVGKQLQELSGRTDPAKIAEAQAIQKDIPDLKMTMAEKSELDDLVKAQGEAGQSLPKDTLDAETARRAGNQRAVEEARVALAPEGQYDPDSIVEVAAGNIGKARNQIAAERQGLTGQEQDIADGLVAQGLKSRTTGEKLREAIKTKRSAVKMQMSKMAQSMGLNDKAAEVDFSSVAKSMKSAYDAASRLRVAFKPELLKEPGKKIILTPKQQQEYTTTLQQDKARNAHTGKRHPTMEILDDLADNQSVNGITQLRSEIAEELEVLVRNPNPGNASQRRGLSAALKTLDDFIDAPIESGSGLASALPDESIAQNYLAFRKAYRTEYADNFERGAIYKGIQKDGRRAYRVRDEELASSFFKPGDEQAALQYKKVFGNDPLAMQAMESAMIDSLASRIGRDGVLSENALNSWLRKHDSVLQHFPDLKKRMLSHKDAIKAIGDRREVLSMREQQIEGNILTRAIKNIDSTGAPAEDFIMQALQKPKLMNELVATLSPSGVGSLPATNSGQRNALARTVWDIVLKQSDPVDFIRKNAQSIKIAMGPEYSRRLSNLTRAMQKLELVTPPTAQGVEAQPLVSKVEGFLNTGLNQVSSRIFAMQSGRTSPRYIATDIAGRAIRGFSQKQANQVMIEALLNPQLADRLTDVVKKPNQFKPLKRLYAYLWTLGIRPYTEGENQDAPAQ